MACCRIAHAGRIARPSVRAYALDQSQLDTYYWLRQSLPAAAVVAASPAHTVNANGETIGLTNFLSGMLERSVYYERQTMYSPAEAHRRQQLLTSLFAAQSAGELQTLLAQATFDYLLVYPDTPPATDLSCCLQLIWDDTPRVYQLRHPATQALAAGQSRAVGPAIPSTP